MSPKGSGTGRRTSVEIGEVVLDETVERAASGRSRVA
jgi:hypothetical protein